MPQELVEGEKINFKPRSIESENLSNDQINSKYSQGDVRIVTEQARYQLPSIPDMVKSDAYNLNPEFQRRHRWTRDQKSRLMESIIMNVPIPPIFLYEDDYSHYEVMDGLQRLTAITDFYDGKYPLSGLEQWPELNGRKYHELPSQIKKGIDRRYLSSIILLAETAKTKVEAVRLKQLVFERINSGGEKLEPQETRNAIYDGPMNQLCIKIARNPDFCELWGIPAPDLLGDQDLEEKLLANERYKKMEDVEMVLRFFAWRQRDARKELNKQSHRALRDFLDIYLKEANLFPESALIQLEDIFIETIRTVRACLGESAFYLYRVKNEKWGWRKSSTLTAYDTIMYAFSKNLDHKALLVEKKNLIANGLPGFYQENYEYFEGRNVNSSALDKRESLFEEYLHSFIDQ